MASIQLKDAAVEIPVYCAGNRSLKSKFMYIASIGKISADANGHVVVRVLNDLDFNFADGDRVGLIGHNGAGKSTLLRVLSGVYPPTQGQIFHRGSVSSLIDISLGIDHEATGRENTYLRGALLGLSKKRNFFQTG